MDVMKEIDTAWRNYTYRTGRDPTYVVLSPVAYELLRGGSYPLAIRDMELSNEERIETVFGMEIVIDDDAFYTPQRISFARRPSKN
uniref:Uncharacterized protein n=1 Tax=Podoviridae sp. ctlpi2 TaxID=2826574 RepID=A0A8S5MLP1_9CAUD|nr:MAG TPA: hypothetical protein [Podoviridae sp. ctlpi2]